MHRREWTLEVKGTGKYTNGILIGLSHKVGLYKPHFSLSGAFL